MKSSATAGVLPTILLTLGLPLATRCGVEGRLVYAEDDDGRRLEAEFTVERDGGLIAVILSSSSGRSGNRPARNPGYRMALELLLTRLKRIDAVLEEALVDTRDTRRMGLPEDERRLTKGPLRLSSSRI